MGPDECVAFTYTSQYLIESFTVRCLFSLRTDKGKQTITFLATNNFKLDSIFNLHKLNCAVDVQVLYSAVQCIHA